jgi:type II secretory pathway component GspD/PulD (secretin)
LISNLPQVTENQIATQAVVNNGDTLVIGGQVVRKIIDNDSGFPFLSKLPIVGLLFGQRSRQYQEYLRIYVINPKILGDDSLQAATSSADQPSGTITNNRMLKDDLPRIIQGTGIPTSPNINLGPSQSEQNRQNSILKAIPMPGGPNN